MISIRVLLSLVLTLGVSAVAPAFSRVPPQRVTLQQQLQQRQQEYGSAVLIVMTGGEISAVESFGLPQANTLTPQFSLVAPSLQCGVEKPYNDFSRGSMSEYGET